MVADIGANLTTSRLASYGFLAEASGDGVTTYKISSVNDDNVCPVCDALDGEESTLVGVARRSFGARDEQPGLGLVLRGRAQRDDARQRDHHNQRHEDDPPAATYDLEVVAQLHRFLDSLLSRTYPL